MRITNSQKQRGSVMILVLLAMMLLMMLGLSLVFVTELEMLMGGSERLISNNFYIAESGIHGALSAIMVSGDWSGEKFTAPESLMGDDYQVGFRTLTSQVQAVGPGQAPPLSIANENEDHYKSFSIIMLTSAERVGWPDTEPTASYEPGDSREADVIVQSRTIQEIRYLLTPVRKPGTPSEPFDISADIQVGGEVVTKEPPPPPPPPPP